MLKRGPFYFVSFKLIKRIQRGDISTKLYPFLRALRAIREFFAFSGFMGFEGRNQES
jgi:hypothetical protein